MCRATSSSRARGTSSSQSGRSCRSRASVSAADATSAGIRKTKRRSLPTSWSSSSTTAEPDPEREQPFGRSAARANRDERVTQPMKPSAATTHMRVKTSCRTGNHDDAIHDRAQVVRRLARHRHLPVVEAVVLPRRTDEDDERDQPREREPGERPERRRPRVCARACVRDRAASRSARGTSTSDASAVEAQRADEEDGRRLREVRQDGGDARDQSPDRPLLRARECPPARPRSGPPSAPP